MEIDFSKVVGTMYNPIKPARLGLFINAFFSSADLTKSGDHAVYVSRDWRGRSTLEDVDRAMHRWQ